MSKPIYQFDLHLPSGANILTVQSENSVPEIISVHRNEELQSFYSEPQKGHPIRHLHIFELQTATLRLHIFEHPPSPTH